MTDVVLTVTAVAPDDAAVLGAWDELSRLGAVRTPFASLEWWLALLEADALDGEPVLLVARDRAGAVVGLLGLETVRHASGLRAIAAPGAAWLAPDHLDVVARPDLAGAVGEAVAGHLAGALDWDLLHLESLRPGSFATAVASSRRGLSLPTEPVVLPYVDLASGADALPWSRGLRQQVGRGRRAAERAGGGVRTARDPDEVVEALEVLMRLHNARFGAASSVFATSARRRFHRSAARRLAERGSARVLRLAAGPADAAVLYGFEVGDTAFYYALGIDPGLPGSPGRTLLGVAVLAAAEEGRREYDLLRGEHDFKLRFASGVRQERSVRRLRPTLAAARFAGGAVRRRVARGGWPS